MIFDAGFVTAAFHWLGTTPAEIDWLSPNSITSILFKTCLKPGFRQVLSRKKVGNLVSDKTDLSRHVEIDLAASFRHIKKSGTWSQTSFEQKKSRKPGFRQVVRQVERLVVRQVVRQDRSNRIWALPSEKSPGGTCYRGASDVDDINYPWYLASVRGSVTLAVASNVDVCV